MNIIKVLPPHEAQKIAAGEVIERPAHILKELLENSIDAGATQISIWVEQSGKQLIRVVDNGCGMSPEDAHMCFLPHATSKVSSLDEVYAVRSYGFRGEALASISAVSKVTLITRLRDDASGVGVKLGFQQGVIIGQEAIACPIGTDLAIRDLFYNIPVRKKFLKADSTEWNQLQAIVQAFCLSHHTLHFKLFHDDKLVINAPPAATVKDRVMQIWDHDLAQNLIQLEESEKPLPWLSYSGLISGHQFWKYGRTHIFFFVNGRWIKNQELSKALLKGYLNVLPPGKFPAAFIFLQVDPAHVDINVHPKKEEVRFIKPATVDAQIFNAVKVTLEQQFNRILQPDTTSISELSFATSTTLPARPFDRAQDKLRFGEVVRRLEEPSRIGERDESSPFNKNFLVHKDSSGTQLPSQMYQAKPAVNWDTLLNLSAVQLQDSIQQSKKVEDIAIQEAIPQESQEKLFSFLSREEDRDIGASFSIIGQLFATYILIQSNDQLIIIDQHAAHERVLYEKYLKNFQYKEGTVLLFPEVIRVSNEQMKILQTVFDFFEEQGILLEQFGALEIVIKTSPPLVAQHDLKNLIFEVIEFVQEYEAIDRELFRKKLNEFTHSHMACKAAVKAGDLLEPIFMHQLVSDLMIADNRFICVHGRPTMWTLGKPTIEKNFRRR